MENFERVESEHGDGIVINKRYEDSYKDLEDRHPSRYQSDSGIEVWDVIEAFNLNYNVGNMVKYLLRLGKKDDPVKELNKVINYAEREIQMYKEGKR